MENKNIIILGAARAGKSTLAKMLQEQYHYSILSIDAFVSALRDGFPSLEITHSNTENKFKKMPSFLFSYMKKITKEYPNTKFVLEGWHVYPKDMIKLFHDLNVKTICLGYTRIDSKEKLMQIRKTEKANSYTTKMPDEQLENLILQHIQYSKELERQCKDNNIKFFDTSFQMDTILKEAMQYVIE